MEPMFTENDRTKTFIDSLLTKKLPAPIGAAIFVVILASGMGMAHQISELLFPKGPLVGKTGISELDMLVFRAKAVGITVAAAERDAVTRAENLDRYNKARNEVEQKLLAINKNANTAIHDTQVIIDLFRHYDERIDKVKTAFHLEVDHRRALKFQDEISARVNSEADARKAEEQAIQAKMKAERLVSDTKAAEDAKIAQESAAKERAEAEFRSRFPMTSDKEESMEDNLHGCGKAILFSDGKLFLSSRTWTEHKLVGGHVQYAVEVLGDKAQVLERLTMGTSYGVDAHWVPGRSSREERDEATVNEECCRSARNIRVTMSKE